MNIDIRTLVLIVGMAHVLQMLVLYQQFRINRDYQGPGWWLTWSAAEVFGFALLLVRGQGVISPVIIFGQNVLIVLGTLFIYIGVCRFLARPVKLLFVYSAFAFYAAAFAYFTFADDNIIIRSILLNIAIAVTALITAASLYHYKNRSVTGSANALSMVFFLHGAFFVFRSLEILNGTVPLDIFRSSFFNYAPYLDALLTGLLATFGFTIMLNQQLHSDWKDEHEHFRVIFSTGPDSILITRSEDGVITDVNEAFTELSGYSRHEAIGTSSLALPLWHDPADRHHVVRALQADGYCRNYKATFLRKDGSHIIGLMSARTISIHGIAHILSVTRDITEFKRMEDEVRVLLESSERSRKALQSLLDEERQIQQALRDSEALFRDLFEKHAAIKLMIDPADGQIIDANAAAAALYGWTQEELRQMNITDLNTLSPEQVLTQLRMVQEKERVCLEFKHRCADGSIKEVAVNSCRIVSSGKDFLHSIVTDITARKLAEEALRREHAELENKNMQLASEIRDRLKAEEQTRLFKQAVDASSVAIVITDVTGSIIYINSSALEATGFTLAEAVGQNPRLFKSGHQPVEFYEMLWTTILSGKDWEGEFRNKKKNGELYWEKAVISPIVNGQGTITHFVAVKQDITQNKILHQDLVSAKRKAEESDKLKTAFLQNISHEIRTPLNGILGFSHFLVEPDLSVDERRQMFDRVQASALRLTNTVTDYLDMAMIVSGTIEVKMSEFRLKPYIEKAAEHTAQLCAARTIEFSITAPDGAADMVIRTDSELLGKVLQIHLDNALKFTKQGRIELGFKQTHAVLEFYIRDTGKGIHSQKLQLIYDIFTQEDPSLTRGYEGSGLGLSIAKGLVTLLGGHIWAESVEGGGSTFHFTIPFVGAGLTGRSANTARSLPPSVAKSLILLAEDDEMNAMYFKEVFRKAGCEHIHARNGVEAVELCRQQPEVTLVLMDVKMPIMNGLDAARQIRAIRSTLPIIATTAYAQTGDKQRCLEAGCDDYLAKPIKPEVLTKMIRKYSADSAQL